MKKTTILLILGVIAIIGIIISFLGDVNIIGHVVKETDKCVNAMERFEELKEDFECKKTMDGEAEVEWCMKDDSLIYYKIYKDGSKEWGLIEGGSSVRYISNNTKKMCE